MGSLAALTHSSLSLGQYYPVKPIKLIVPFPPGGGGDTLARLVMTRVGKELGQPIVVENLAGAGGNICSQTVVRAAADSYTLLYGTSGTHGINQTLYKNVSFDAKAVNCQWLLTKTSTSQVPAITNDFLSEL